MASKKYIELECFFCKDKFTRSLRRFKQAQKRGYVKYYCSKRCSHNAIIKTILTNCTTCGKVIKRGNYALKRSKSGNLFCGSRCSAVCNSRAGIEANNYKNGTHLYRKIAIEKYGEVCSVCGYNQVPEILEVHHIDCNRNNNDISNLRVLCPTHHRENHYHLRRHKSHSRVV